MANTPAKTQKVDPGQTDPQDALPKADAKDTAQASDLANVGKVADDAKPGEDYAVYGVDPSTVEKVTVKTSGNFNLQDPFTRALIDANDEDGTEVVKTPFIADKLESGELVEA